MHIPVLKSTRNLKIKLSIRLQQPLLLWFWGNCFCAILFDLVPYVVLLAVEVPRELAKKLSMESLIEDMSDYLGFLRWELISLLGQVWLRKSVSYILWDRQEYTVTKLKDWVVLWNWRFDNISEYTMYT